MKWRAAGSDFLEPRGMARSARGRKSRTDVAGTRSRAREAGSAFGQTSLYRGRRWVRPSRKHMERRRAVLIGSAIRISRQLAQQQDVVHLGQAPRPRVVTRNGDRRYRQTRRVSRSWHRKIDNEAGDVSAMWMQHRPPHPRRPPCEASRYWREWTWRSSSRSIVAELGNVI